MHSGYGQQEMSASGAPTLLNAELHGIHGRVCFRGSRWQGELERRASSIVRCGPDTPAMRLNDRLADCQAHAAALWFRSEERVEYLVGVARR
jgi:hypothetical protein